MALKKCTHKFSGLNRVRLCEQYVCINQQSINAFEISWFALIILSISFIW